MGLASMRNTFFICLFALWRFFFAASAASCQDKEAGHFLLDLHGILLFLQSFEISPPLNFQMSYGQLHRR